MSGPMHGLEILYEDEAILVINKPAGLLVIPDRWDPGKSTVVQLAQMHRRAQGHAQGDQSVGETRVWAVHRLDRETSGVLVVAKSPHAHAVISQQFARAEVHKSYLGLVRGQVPHPEGCIDLPIGMHPSQPGLMAIRRRHGKAAVTCYRVVERFRGFTLLNLQPETGRTHQLRVHLRAIGFPLAIDPPYGGSSAIFLSALKPSYKPKASHEEPPLMARLTLHAEALRLAHPSHGGSVEWVAPLPKDFAAVLRNLRRFQHLPGEPLPPPPDSGGKQEGLQR
ncbi:MAG: RluA family pseudouridine synthase [Candidatus Entotheonellia bacterium]